MAKKLKYDGQDIVAKYAECDSAGNKISETYASANSNLTVTGDWTFSSENGLDIVGRYNSFLNFKKLGWIQFNDSSDNAIYYDTGGYFNFMSNDGNPLQIYNGEIKNIFSLESQGSSYTIAVKSDLEFDNDKVMHFKGDYSAIYFRYKNAPNNVQPNGIIEYDDSTGTLNLYASNGVAEKYSGAPYHYGYKYVGRFQNTSSNGTKFDIHIRIDTPSNATPTKYAELRKALYDAGYTSQAYCCPATGVYGSGSQVLGLYASSSTISVVFVTSASGGTENYSSINSSYGTYSFKKLN